MGRRRPTDDAERAVERIRTTLAYGDLVVASNSAEECIHRLCDEIDTLRAHVAELEERECETCARFAMLEADQEVGRKVSTVDGLRMTLRRIDRLHQEALVERNTARRHAAELEAAIREHRAANRGDGDMAGNDDALWSHVAAKEG